MQQFELIDFSDCKKTNRMYGGANGKKIGVFYNEERYLLKFAIENPNKEFDYFANHICEFLGCHIFNLCQIESQHTILGTYKGIPVVACKDFIEVGEEFYDFISIQNSILEVANGNQNYLEDILQTIELQDILSKNLIKQHFWQTFIVDTLIGNFDRHNGNWGVIFNETKNQYKIPPVFDCGSCLFPKILQHKLTNILKDENEINQRIYVYPRSAIKLRNLKSEDNNDKINPLNFLLTTKNKDCLNALIEIHARINIDEIQNFIQKTTISNQLKDFYCKILQERKIKILDKALEYANSLNFSFFDF